MRAPSGHDGTRLALALAVLALIAGSALGQQVRATVDRNTIGLDEQFILKVTVEGVADSVPELPPLEDHFRVMSAGTSVSTMTVNGRTSVATEASYLLIPLKTGTFEIGPVTAELGGKRYASRPFSVRVVEASADPAPNRDVFVTARVSNDRPYLGEQVLFTWRFYRRVPVGEASLTALDFGGLVSEELGEVREFDTTVDGVQYRVSELRRALFPQKVGKVTIPASELSVQVPADSGRRRRSVFDFGRVPSQTKLLRSRPIELDVQPLPPAPAGFSGLVGRFDLAVEVSKRSLKVNESATLTVTVSGKGNVQLLHAPPLPPLDAFKTYEDKPSGRIERGGLELTGSKTYRTALVPLVPGEHRIPSLELVSFDPERKEYRTVRSEPIVLDVSPAEGDEELRLTESIAPGAGKVAVRILADDVLPIERSLTAVAPGPLAGLSGWLWLVLAVAPPAAFGALLVRDHRRSRSAANRARERRRHALRRAVSSLEGLQDGGATGTVEELARQASQAVRGYVGDKLGVEGAALTPLEVSALLEEGGVDEATTRRAREMLERLEAAQYGSSVARLDAAALGKSLSGMLRDVDRELDRGDSERSR